METIAISCTAMQLQAKLHAAELGNPSQAVLWNKFMFYGTKHHCQAYRNGTATHSKCCAAKEVRVLALNTVYRTFAGFQTATMTHPEASGGPL